MAIAAAIVDVIDEISDAVTPELFIGNSLKSTLGLGLAGERLFDELTYRLRSGKPPRGCPAVDSRDKRRRDATAEHHPSARRRTADFFLRGG
jgi:hypothetical protein